MEISIVSPKSLRIRSKSTTFILNPEKKSDENVIVFTHKLTDFQDFDSKLVIDGPGDFETSGVSIKGERQGEGMVYDFFEEGQRLLILSDPSVAKSVEASDATAVAVFLNGNPSALSEVACDVVALIGSEESLPNDKSNIKRTDKLNLKKTEEYKGYLVHLSK